MKQFNFSWKLKQDIIKGLHYQCVPIHLNMSLGFIPVVNIVQRNFVHCTSCFQLYFVRCHTISLFFSQLSLPDDNIKKV